VSRDRFVALGLARARSPWFTDVARWATSATLPLEFCKCLSPEQARAWLTAGRPFSVLVADGTVPGVDRDLIDLARANGVAVLIVDDPRVDREWLDLGAHAVLADDFDRDDLLAALEAHARPLADAAVRPGGPARDPLPAWRGSMVAVMGVGGCGGSTVAMALAQGLAQDPRHRAMVVLADLARHGDQALLHDAPDVVPGLPELVEAHRSGTPSAEEVIRTTFAVQDRGYRLLLGLRRHRDWAGLRARALGAALDSLQRTSRVLVTDTDDDVEGEQQCGSVDVEERNLAARLCAERAEVVAVVTRPGVTGTHRLLRTLGALAEVGVPAERLLPVVNRAPRSPRARAELSRAIASLAGADLAEAGLANPLFVAERRHLEAAAHAGAPLPDVLCRSVTAAVAHHLERVGPRDRGGAGPEPVAVGSLGHFDDPMEAAT
jgi:hypothetical protein